MKGQQKRSEKTQGQNGDMEENTERQQGCFAGYLKVYWYPEVGDLEAVVAGLLTQIQMQAKNRTEGLGYHNGRVAEVGEIDHKEW